MLKSKHLQSAISIKIQKFDLNGNFIKDFVSSVDAGKQLGIENTILERVWDENLKHITVNDWKHNPYVVSDKVNK